MPLEQFLNDRWDRFANTLRFEPRDDDLTRGLQIIHYMENDKLAHIMLDDNCCLLHVHETGENRLTISLEELMLARKKEDCPRKGKDYLRILRIMNDEFWSVRTNYVGYPYTHVTFQIDIDASHIVGLERFVCTDLMIDQTNALYQYMLSMEAKNSAENRTINLASFVDMEELRRNYLVKDFMERALMKYDLHEQAVRGTERKEISGLSIRSGRVLVSDLAYVCLRITYESPSVDRFVQRMWFEILLPAILSHNEITRALHITASHPFSTQRIVDAARIRLSVITPLSRDDAKTWYMADLGLSICSLAGHDESYYIDSLNRFRDSTIDEVRRTGGGQAFGCLPERATIKFIVNFFVVKHLRTECGTGRNCFSYFDAMVYSEIESTFKQHDQGKIYDAFSYNVCRVLLL